MFRRLQLFVFLFFLFVSVLRTAQAQSRVDCAALNSRILKQAVRYCVLLPPNYDTAAGKRFPVLYFLHGLGDNEQTLINTGGWDLIDNLRRQRQIGDFLIVTPEGKRSFYINSVGGSSNYGDFFLREFMPAIERKYRTPAGRNARAITGMSMGGYGALRLAFAYPQLFSAVSAQSPALITESPQQLNAAMGSGSPLLEMLADIFGRPINVSHWRQNNPFLLATKNKIAIRKLAIYFNCGSNDNYGFEKGAQALHQQLQAEGIAHEYHLYPGDHSLPYFLTHLSETMKFHSAVFQAHGR